MSEVNWYQITLWVQLISKSMLKRQRSILVEIHPEAQLLHGPLELLYLKPSQDYISSVLYFRSILLKSITRFLTKRREIKRKLEESYC